MLRFDYNDIGSFGVTFNYDKDTDGRIITEAVLCESEKVDTRWKDSIVALGHAECHPLDNFKKETGRKLALGRALARFNKDFRTKVWEVYRSR